MSSPNVWPSHLRSPGRRMVWSGDATTQVCMRTTRHVSPPHIAMPWSTGSRPSSVRSLDEVRTAESNAPRLLDAVLKYS